MTVNIITTRETYLGDGVSISFPFHFRVDNQGELVVWVDEKIIPVTLAWNADPATGGTFTLPSPPAAGASIVAERNSPRTQPVRLLEHDINSAEVTEGELDRIVLLIQEIQTQLDRCTQFAPTDDLTGISVAFPMPGAGKGIRWNVQGTALEVFTIPSGGGGGGAGVTSLGGMTGDIGLRGDFNMRLFANFSTNELTIAWQNLLPLSRGGTNNDGNLGEMPRGGVLYRSPLVGTEKVFATLPGTAPRRPVLCYEGAPGFTDFVTVSSLSTDGPGGIRVFAWGPDAFEGGEVRWYSQSVGGLPHFVAFKAPDNRLKDSYYTLPMDDPTNGQALVSDANGHLFWASVGGAGGGSVGPAVPNQIAYFNGTTSVTGSPGFIWSENPRLLALRGPMLQIKYIGALDPGPEYPPNNGDSIQTRVALDATKNEPVVGQTFFTGVSAVNGSFPNVVYGHLWDVMHLGDVGTGGLNTGVIQAGLIAADQALANSTVAQLTAFTAIYRILAGAVDQATCLILQRNQGAVGSLVYGIGLLIPQHAAPFPVYDIAIWTFGGEHRLRGNVSIGTSFQTSVFPLTVYYTNAAGASPLYNVVLAAIAPTVHDGHGPGIAFTNVEGDESGTRTFLGHFYMARTNTAHAGGHTGIDSYCDLAINNNNSVMLAWRVQPWGGAVAFILAGTATEVSPLLWASQGDSKLTGLRGPVTRDRSVIWVLPPTAGTAGQVLSTDGTDQLRWISGGLGGTNLQPPGVLVVNNAGQVTTDPGNFSWDENQRHLTVGAQIAGAGAGAYGMVNSFGNNTVPFLGYFTDNTTNAVQPGLDIVHKSASAAADGFGVSIRFAILAAGASILTAQMYTQRLSALNTHRWGLQTNIAGTLAERISIDTGGSFIVNSPGHFAVGGPAQPAWMAYIAPAGSAAGCLLLDAGTYFMSMPIEDPRPAVLQVHRGSTTASVNDLHPTIFASLISRSTKGGETGNELAPAAILAYARLQDVHTTGTVCALQGVAEMVVPTNQGNKVDGSDGGAVGIRTIASCMVANSYAWASWFEAKDNGLHAGIVGCEINTVGRYAGRAFGDVRGLNLVNYGDGDPNNSNNNDIGVLALGYGTVWYQLGQPRIMFDLTAATFSDTWIKTGTSLIIKQAATGGKIIEFCGLGPGGVRLGSAVTDPGLGWINLSGGIQRNGIAYSNPDYVFEHWATGDITRHADKEGAGAYMGHLPLAVIRDYVREHYQFPALRRLAKPDLFSAGEALLETLEEGYLYLFDHEARLTDCERRLDAIEFALAKKGVK